MKALGAHFGRVVREMRQQCGWSQEDLADRAALNRSFLGEVERNTVVPSLATMEKIACAFDLRVSVLVSRCEALAQASASTRASAEAGA